MTVALPRQSWPIWLAIVLALVAHVSARTALADSVVFTSNTTIDAGDTSYEGYDVTVRGCTVTINGPHSFASLTVTDTGIVTHSAGSVLGLDLTITGNLTVALGCSISASGCGYGSASGPGAGGSDGGGESGGGGASYGGEGRPSTAVAGTVYGDVKNPLLLGSGGGSGRAGTYAGGAGGGLIRLTVTGAMVVDGRLECNGNGAPYAGGGSGGSIFLAVGVLSGTGLISARGGTGTRTDGWGVSGGGGGGGRIAVHYAQYSFAGSITASGAGSTDRGIAGAGTIYSKRPDQVEGDLWVHNEGNSGGYTVLNYPVRFDNVRVSNRAILVPPVMGALSMSVVHDCNIDAGGFVSAWRRGHAAAHGPGAGKMDVGGESGGGGGSFGGRGTVGSAAAGEVYGDPKDPVDQGQGEHLGSGGGSGRAETYTGGAGGGAIDLTVGGVLTVDGGLDADGEGANYAGAGSGGSLLLRVGSLAGGGWITAKGGHGNRTDGWGVSGGGGGGGRIVIRYSLSVSEFGGVLSAAGGTSADRGTGGAGTIVLRSGSQTEGDLWIHNDGNQYGATPITGPIVFDNVRIWGKGIVEAAVPPLDLTVLGDCLIEPGGFITGYARGFACGTGPGRGSNDSGGESGGGGGGYGGIGAAGSAPGGGVYGSDRQPIDFGSGGGTGRGGSYTGGAGGGAIRLSVNGTLTVNGILEADGAAANYAGGGAGGSVLLRVGMLAGTGRISAYGGFGRRSDGWGISGGGGGGGRVAIYYAANAWDPAGIISAAGGGSSDRGPAQDGTVYMEQTTGNYTVSLTVNDSSLGGGQSTVGVLALNTPAPEGGLAVQVQSSAPSVAAVPLSVSFAAGETVAQFPVTASSVTAPKTVTITARLWDRTSTAQLTVNPWLSKLMVNPSAAASGDTVAGTLVLSTPAPDGGLLVALASDKPTALTVPTSVLVAPGQKVATFDMVAGSVTKTTTVSVSASYLAESRAATVYVNPAGAQIKAFVISPASVLGGQSAQGVITLTKRAPASGLNIALTSSDPSGVTVPTYVNIPGDRTSGYFKIATKAGLPAESVVVTATISGAGSGGKAQATLVIRATGIKSLVLSPAVVYGGETAIGLVTLDSMPLAPVVITVQCDQSVAVPEPSIVIPAGQTTGAFFIDTLPVSARVLATVTARANGTQRSKRLTIDPDPGGKRRWRGAPR